ncbi:MAG: tetratricopeptide repeat protein [Deltaproteobacteria bacterium]|nr:tetratricopeptide repeat protein [Deltaproteobacteria bacterium]
MRALLFGLVVLVSACGRPAPAKPLPPMTHEAYAYYLDGKLAAYRSDWPAAVESLALAAKAAPDQPMIAVELARVQAKAKREVAAAATLAAARKKWPRHAQVWLMSGDLMSTTKRGEAIKAYRRAIQLAPDDERGYLGLAKLESPSESEAVLRQLVEKIPDSVEGHYRLAQRFAKRNDLKTAIKELQAVIERDPDHIDARLDLARALRRTGRMTQAIEQTRSAFDRSGQALDIAEELYWLLCEADDRTAAMDLLTLLDDDRSDVEALAAIARLARGLGRLTQARAIAIRISAVDPDAGTLVHAELDTASDPQGAVKRLLAITADSPRFAEARRLAGDILLATGDPKGASSVIAPAREATPKDLDLALVAAYAKADAGDATGARAVLAQLDNSVGAQLARARLEDHLRSPATALAILEPLIAKHPDSTTALNLAGYILADRGERLGDAEKWLAHARNLAPGDPAILDSWGWLQLKRGKVREAVRALDRASRFAPNEPEILVHLAAARAADKAPKAAWEALDRAVALKPSPSLLARIEAVRATLPPRQ